MINYFLRLFVAVDKINQNKIAYTFFYWQLKNKEIPKIDVHRSNGALDQSLFWTLEKQKKITKKYGAQGYAFGRNWDDVSIGRRTYFVVDNTLKSYTSEGDLIYDFDKTTLVTLDLTQTN